MRVRVPQGYDGLSQGAPGPEREVAQGATRPRGGPSAVAGPVQGPGESERRAADWLIGGAPLPAQAIEVC